jgi:hypothetical protein
MLNCVYSVEEVYGRPAAIMRRAKPTEEAEEIIIEGEAVQPVMVDYNIILMYMNRTPVGEMGCGANIVLLLIAGGLCVGASHLYNFLISVMR